MTFWKIIAFLKVSGDFLHFSENPIFVPKKAHILVILGAFNVIVCVLCCMFFLYFDVVTYVKALDSLHIRY